ncbi:universal stress protein UspE [Pseudoruegeria aquimaris]|uniref:Universal stress protein UspE n=1 Tax=Pseudoruegeria aquimaris TaxID=393663 RepID=A0A1Y5SSU0_9RHOB|nr:universal stress protein [Pseudoruegeria aquimaris]SLN44433.1 universal stress protein UspE [Pseudoruegeria aquimaris]
MKNIVVATDLSGRSAHALTRAFQLAEQSGARVAVVKVADDDLPETMSAKIQIDAQDMLEALCEAEAARHPAPFSIEVLTGDPAHCIRACARDYDSDLIILGAHRRRGFLDGMRETTLEHVVRIVRRPVLLAAMPVESPYTKVLLPMDFSPASTAAAHAALKVAPAAEINAFHAVHVPYRGFGRGNPDGSLEDIFLQEAREERDKWWENAGLPASFPKPELSEGSPQQILDARRALFDPDLIAVGAHSRATAARWIVGSFAAGLVRNPPCDVLVTRPR